MRNVYEENGRLIYEKISRIIDTPFWGINSDVLERLENSGKEFYVKLVWKNHGGLLLDKTNLATLLRDINITQKNQYKITMYEIRKAGLRYKWDDKLLSALES